MSGKARAFCFTINNYSQDALTRLEELECVYLIYGKELAPTTGTPHLQGYVYFKNPRSLVSIRKLLNGHVTVANGTAQQNFDYCSKSGNFIERGVRPLDRAAGGTVESDRWELAKDAAMEGRWSDIPTDMFIRYGRAFKRLKMDLSPPPQPLPEREYYGLWIYGPNRTGKSHFLWTKCIKDGLFYSKLQNEWWCGYAGERIAVIQEYDPSKPNLVTEFKQWVDRWPYSGNRKHDGAVFMRPNWIIVTSNYSLEECFHGQDYVSMTTRRFKQIHLDKVTDEEIFNLD